MERERGSKIIAIVALCVGVVGLSLGFAAFSSQLVIRSSATVTPDASEFSVVFDGEIAESVVGGAEAGDPTISTETITQGDSSVEASTVGDLSAAFTAPGQSVTYTVDAKNAGKYIAYLTNVTFAAPEKTCTAKEGTTQAYVDLACENISLTLKVGDEVITSGTTSYTNEIAIGGTTPVEVTIAYAEVEGQTLADGDFDVEFGDIQLTYSSVR